MSRFRLLNTLIIALAACLSLPVLAGSPLERCSFVFSSRRNEVLQNLQKVQKIIDSNWFVTGRGWFEYNYELSDSRNAEYSLQDFILKPRVNFRWWDSGTGQGVAVREAHKILQQRGQNSEIVVNSLHRPLSSYWLWPKKISYLNGVRSEDLSKTYVEQFDLITDVFGPGGAYSVDLVGVVNSYLKALAVGGRLVMLTSFRTKIMVRGKAESLSHWLEKKLVASGDYRVFVTKNHTLWVEKLRSSPFQVSDLDLEFYRSAEELYRGYIEPES